MPDITLLTRDGLMHRTGGLNWGSNALNHTRPYDSYIPIHIGTIRSNPGLFYRKPAVQQVVNFHWDDGVVMQGLFEGNGPDGYPKQISSTPNKDILGRYFRGRLGLPITRRISLNNLISYGRTTVTIERIDDLNYSLDFSV
ncbi:restriction endonuclease PLD domain-containing protein [Winogradskyella flava]|uniref:restriction endonuclease PLD domain-containing protein n=1 Tax=Winogradskyella flava TaxID=1884876 RepID=UPI0024921BF8|nr:restriction endonuclease PLD domain-containing protein [Winogradskyella flava]